MIEITRRPVKLAKDPFEISLTTHAEFMTLLVEDDDLCLYFLENQGEPEDSEMFCWYRTADAVDSHFEYLASVDYRGEYLHLFCHRRSGLCR